MGLSDARIFEGAWLTDDSGYADGVAFCVGFIVGYRREIASIVDCARGIYRVSNHDLVICRCV